MNEKVTRVEIQGELDSALLHTNQGRKRTDPVMELTLELGACILGLLDEKHRVFICFYASILQSAWLHQFSNLD